MNETNLKILELCNQEPMTGTELSNVLGMNLGYIGRVVLDMHDKGLLHRFYIGGVGNQIAHSLTKTGIEALSNSDQFKKPQSILTTGQRDVLLLLTKGPLLARDIAEASNRPCGGIINTVSDLITKRYVHRFRIRGEKSFYYGITDSGKNILS